MTIQSVRIKRHLPTNWRAVAEGSHLPDALSNASMHDEALDLAEHLQSLLDTDNLRIRMPWFLLRAKCAEDVRPRLADNLLEFPQNPRALTAAEVELAMGNQAQAEFHYPEALKWVGTELPFRDRILGGLKELLQNTNQSDAVRTLLQQEDEFLASVFPRRRDPTPGPPPNAESGAQRSLSLR